MAGAGVPIFNRQHPLAAGIIAAFYPGAFAGAIVPNLAFPGQGDLTTRTGTGINLGQTPEGLGIAYSGTAVQGTTGPTPLYCQRSVGMSIFCRAFRTTQAPGTNHPSNILGVNSSLTPFNCYAMGFGGTQVTGTAITVYQTTTSSAQSGAIVPATGKMFSAGVSFAGGAGNVALWVNGVKDTVSAPATVNVVYNGTITTNLGSGNSTNPVSAMPTAGYMWYPRLLSDSEHRYLDQNPYCLFLWPADLMTMEFVGAIPPPVAPPTSQPFLSPLTIGVGIGAKAGRAILRNRVISRRAGLLGRWD